MGSSSALACKLGRYSPRYWMMRGRTTSLLPLEESLILAADRLRRHGEQEFYGYKVAREMQDAENRLTLPSHGTIYKVLSRRLPRFPMGGRQRGAERRTPCAATLSTYRSR
jgi:hypothetical protein